MYIVNDKAMVTKRHFFWCFAHMFNLLVSFINWKVNVFKHKNKPWIFLEFCIFLSSEPTSQQLKILFFTSNPGITPQNFISPPPQESASCATAARCLMQNSYLIYR